MIDWFRVIVFDGGGKRSLSSNSYVLFRYGTVVKISKQKHLMPNVCEFPGSYGADFCRGSWEFLAY